MSDIRTNDSTNVTVFERINFPHEKFEAYEMFYSLA